MVIYCQDCAHFKGDGENCIDYLTIAFKDIPLKHCAGFHSKKNTLLKYIKKGDKNV